MEKVVVSLLLVIVAGSVALAYGTGLPAPHHVRMVSWNGMSELRWQTVPGAKSYVVERDGEPITSALLSTYAVLIPGKAGQYRVAAYAQGNLGAWSPPMDWSPPVR